MDQYKMVGVFGERAYFLAAQRKSRLLDPLGFDADLQCADKEDASKDACATTTGSGMGGCTVADSFLG
jgi:hypothetical protein